MRGGLSGAEFWCRFSRLHFDIKLVSKTRPSQSGGQPLLAEWAEKICLAMQVTVVCLVVKLGVQGAVVAPVLR